MNNNIIKILSLDMQWVWTRERLQKACKLYNIRVLKDEWKFTQDTLLNKDWTLSNSLEMLVEDYVMKHSRA